MDYKDLYPVNITTTTPEFPEDVKLKDCHARKIFAFGDIETKTGEGGKFSDPLKEDVISIYFSVYVHTPAYQPTDHYVKRNPSKINKSTEQGAEKVMEDFVFLVGDCNKVHKLTFTSSEPVRVCS